MTGLNLRPTKAQIGEARARAAKSGIQFADLVDIIRKRIWLIAGIALLFAAGAVYKVTTVTPRFVADAQMLLGEQGLSDRNSFDLLEAQALNNSVIEGELAILRSNALLVRVVRSLKLNEDEEFNPALQEKSEPFFLVSWARGLKNMFTPSDDAPAEGAEGAETDGADPSGLSAEILNASSANAQDLGEMDNIVRRLRNRVSVRQQGNSFVVSVAASSSDPRKAAAITNTVMNEYIAFLTDKRFQAAQRFTKWLEGRVEELAGKLEESEKEALAFRAVIESDADSSDRLEQQMRELTTKLVNARAALAEAEAHSSKVGEISQRDGELAAADILSTEAILDYRGDIANLRRDEATAIVTFGPNSPQVEAIGRARDKIEESIRTEVRRTVQQLKNSAAILEINVTALETSLRRLEGLILTRSNEQIRLNQLQRVADANRRVYEEFLGRFKESSEIQNLQTADADVISYASPPGAAAYPRKKVTVILATAAGLFVGLAAAFGLEMRPERIRVPGQVTRQTGLTLYGKIPALPGNSTPASVLRFVASNPNSQLAQAAQLLQSNLDLSSGGDGANCVMVTSDTAGADKTTVSLLLAWAASKKGRRCLLVDGDVRTASLSNALGLRNKANLATVLYDETPLDNAIVKVGNLDINVLPTTRLGADPSMIFGTRRAHELLQSLSKQFDVIIFDAPAQVESSDQLDLSRDMDLGLFVIASGKNGIAELREPLRVFQSQSLRETGAVLTSLPQRLI